MYIPCTCITTCIGWSINSSVFLTLPHRSLRVTSQQTQLSFRSWPPLILVLWLVRIILTTEWSVHMHTCTYTTTCTVHANPHPLSTFSTCSTSPWCKIDIISFLFSFVRAQDLHSRSNLGYQLIWSVGVSVNTMLVVHACRARKVGEEHVRCGNTNTKVQTWWIMEDSLWGKLMTQVDVIVQLEVMLWHVNGKRCLGLIRMSRDDTRSACLTCKAAAVVSWRLQLLWWHYCKLCLQ